MSHEKNYKQILEILIESFEKKLIEREPFIRMQLLFMFAKQHYFYIGEPGTGKTYFCKLLFSCIKDAVIWEIQMTKGTTEEMLIGTDLEDPKSIKNAHFVFFDELYKGDPNILVKLLSFLNERVFTIDGDLQGYDNIKNEKDLTKYLKPISYRPFDDRFMGRSEIKRIQTKENRKKFIKKEFDISKDIPVDLFLADIDYCFEEAKKVEFSEEFELTYLKLMETTIKESVKCSDRKFGYAIEILKMSAFLNGRKKVNNSDIFIMKNIAWSNYQDRTNIRRILNEVMYGKKEDIQEKLQNIEKEVTKIISLKNSDYLELLSCKKEFTGRDKDNFFLISRDELLKIEKLLNQEFDRLAEISENYENVKFIEDELKQNIFIYDEKNDVFTVEIVTKMISLYEKIKNNKYEISNFLFSYRNLSDYENKFYESKFEV